MKAESQRRGQVELGRYPDQVRLIRRVRVLGETQGDLIGIAGPCEARTQLLAGSWFVSSSRSQFEAAPHPETRPPQRGGGWASAAVPRGPMMPQAPLHPPPLKDDSTDAGTKNARA